MAGKRETRAIGLADGSGGTSIRKDAVNPREVIELGAEALSVVRNTLAMRYRFLDRALWKMPMVPTPLVNIVGTDTRKLYYNPTDVLRRFASGADELTRDMLHAVFHCLFYHPFIRSDIDQGLWDLSCDIVTEAACLDLAGESFPSKGDADRIRAVGQLETALGNLSAEKLYMHFSTNEIPYEELVNLDALFMRDEHGLWYAVKDEAPALSNDAMSPDDGEGARLSAGADSKALQMDVSEDDRGPVDFEGEVDRDDYQDSDGGQDAEEGSSEEPSSDEFGQQTPPPEPDDRSREEWEHISRRVKVEISNAIDRYGSEAGSFGMRLSIANRTRYDYRAFLSRFAELREEMRLNPDEFDLIYYNFGIETYGNVPLIEPLEYTDSNKIRTFVVAIDTSGSVQGELVERFLEETYAILSESSSFFEQFCVRIVQCDARVQSDVAIGSRDELVAYLEDFELLGMGGTDFRPVFEHVDALVEAGEIEGLRGLIYFTDGKGTYPAVPPDYETVFVFVDDEYDVPAVPPWAYKLVLDEFQLRFLEKGSTK